MFWTAIICGAGASLGACVGLFVFMVLVGALLRNQKTDNRKLAEESLEALQERNRLAIAIRDRLEMIATAIERK